MLLPLFNIFLSEESQEYAGGDCGAYDSGHVGGHRVHQQVVGRVSLEAGDLGHAGAVGNGAHPGVAYKGIYLVLRFAYEEVHQLHEKHSGDRGHYEGQQAEAEDLERSPADEHVGLGGCAHGEAYQYGHHVDECSPGGLGQAVGDARLLQEVAEEQHAEQGKARRDYEGRADEGHDGENDLFLAADLAGLLHLYLPLLLGREHQHYGPLDDGHQGHVGIGRHGYGSHELGGELGAEEYGRGAVCAAYDAYGTRLVGREAQGEREQVGPEYADLGGCAYEHEPGLGNERREISHGPYAQENQGRIPALADSLVEYVQHRALLVDAHVKPGQDGDVAHNDAEAYGDQQQRLPFLDYAEHNEQHAYGYHRDVGECSVGEAGEVPELGE